MDILYVRNTDFDLPEANKVQVANMCKAYQENGCHVQLLAYGKNTKQIEERYKFGKFIKTCFIKTKVRFFIFGDILFFLYFLAKSRQVRFIHTRDIVFGILVKTFFKHKIVFFETHDVPVKPWWKYIFRKYVPLFDKTIVISRGLKENLAKIGVNTDNMIILQDAVDLKEFDKPISKEEARKELGLPQGKIIVCYVGSTDKGRDLATLISAAKKMKEIVFVVFGKEADYLKKAAEKYPNFIFKGYTNTPALAYKAADILFAGYSDKVSTIDVMSPLKIFEHLATRRPSIVADFPRTREVLSEKEVYFYQSENSGSLVEKIDEVLKNKNTVSQKTENAFKKAKKYTWQKRTNEIISWFKKVQRSRAQ